MVLFLKTMEEEKVNHETAMAGGEGKKEDCNRKLVHNHYPKLSIVLALISIIIIKFYTLTHIYTLIFQLHILTQKEKENLHPLTYILLEHMTQDVVIFVFFIFVNSIAFFFY